MPVADDIRIDVHWARYWVVPPNWRFERIVRPCTTIWYIQQGTLGFLENGRAASLSARTLALLPAERVQAVWNAGSKPLHYYSLGCDVSMNEIDLFPFQEPVLRTVDLPERATDAWQRIVTLWDSVAAGSATMLRLQFAAGVRELWAHVMEQLALDPIQDVVRLDLRVRRTLEIVHRDLAESPRIADIARELHVSESHLRHILTASLKMSYRELLLSLKMRRAKRLLAAGEQSIGEIAHALGYSDQRHFSRAFAQSEGLLPSHYRKRVASLGGENHRIDEG